MICNGPLAVISANIEAAPALSLLSAQAVRARTRQLYDLALDGKLLHFRIVPERMPALAHFVAGIVRQNYPTLAVPFHARWRHFHVQGEDRWAALQAGAQWRNADDKARAAFDLAIISVLLDAGAGPRWTYRDKKSGRAIGRSEGLAIASLDMFARGDFSADAKRPLQADAQRLALFSIDELRRGFQVSADNPLEGLEGRVSLLNVLGRAVLDRSNVLARKCDPRPGGLFDHLKESAQGGPARAPDILRHVLLHMGGIWPSRIALDGVLLGDTWRHPLVVAPDSTNGLVPFHKLSQWLSYSLIEPLIDHGIAVTDINGMTGLAEYRNGGLFVDGGVIEPKDQLLLTQAHQPDSTVIVEWRALTVALLDELLPLVQKMLGQPAQDFPLARMLEGGTWAAGRALARERRADGAPPITIVSDGTVF